MKTRHWVIALLMILAHAEGMAGTVEINDRWRFVQQEVEAAEKPGFNDSSWERLSVPHNWGYVEAQQGNVGYYRGPGWYRRALDIGFKEDCRYFVRFGAGSVD